VTTGPMESAVDGRGRLRASDADRERAIEALKVAFVQGRLTRDELDLRAGQAFCSRTYAELAAVTADIPAGPAAIRPRPVPEGPANRWGLKLALALAAVALPIVIAEALVTGSKDLFSGTTLALMACVLTLRIALTSVICARLERMGRDYRATSSIIGAEGREAPAAGSAVRAR
jgi:uncharacterized protein DUF1707